MLNTKLQNRQRGIGLIELMIGMTVGLIILSGTISLYIHMIKSSSNTLLSAKLNQDLAAVMSLVVSDIRRAGYWGSADSSNLNNPFTVTLSPSSNLNILTSNSCIMYTYDRNSDGTTANEFFGFRHIDSDGDTVNDSIQLLNGSGSTTDDCTVGSWIPLTDPKTIVVDTLIFSSTGSKCLNSSSSPAITYWSIDTSPSASSACDDTTATGYTLPNSGDLLVESRQVTVTLSGHLRSDSAVTKSLTQTINLRNDLIFKES